MNRDTFYDHYPEEGNPFNRPEVSPTLSEQQMYLSNAAEETFVAISIINSILSNLRLNLDNYDLNETQINQINALIKISRNMTRNVRMIVLDFHDILNEIVIITNGLKIDGDIETGDGEFPDTE